jgi:hypothetical protein
MVLDYADGVARDVIRMDIGPQILGSAATNQDLHISAQKKPIRVVTATVGFGREIIESPRVGSA